jgi:hypothetical protein
VPEEAAACVVTGRLSRAPAKADGGSAAVFKNQATIPKTTVRERRPATARRLVRRSDTLHAELIVRAAMATKTDPCHKLLLPAESMKWEPGGADGGLLPAGVDRLGREFL